jgi:hypothetical protein
MSTQAEREAEVAALIARALDPEDSYDGHHGTDRSPESLEWLRVNDPATYARVTLKIAMGE